MEQGRDLWVPESSGGVVDSVVALDLPPLAPPPSPPSASPPSKQQSASPAHASGVVGGDEAGEEHLLHEVMGYDRKSQKPAHRPQAPSMARRGLLKVTPAIGEREGLGGGMSVWPTRLCMPDCLVVGEQDLDFFADEQQQQHAQQPATPPQQHRRGVTPTLPSATHTPTAARAQHAGRQAATPSDTELPVHLQLLHAVLPGLPGWGLQAGQDLLSVIGHLQAAVSGCVAGSAPPRQPLMRVGSMPRSAFIRYVE